MKNSNGLGILPIEKEQSEIWTEASAKKKAEQQLSLFQPLKKINAAPVYRLLSLV